MYNVLYTAPEDQRREPTKLTVALRGEDVDLLFSCPIMEAVCEHKYVYVFVVHACVCL